MERATLTRVRWRLRGAWQWPSFAALVVVDAILLQALPIAGDGPDAFAAVVLALFFNLVAVAVVGPAIGWAWRRRRPDLPVVIARDRGGTAALLLMTIALVGVGIAHHSALTAQQEELAAQALVVAGYVGHRTDAEYQQYRAHLDAIDTMRFGDDLYRSCVPGDDPARPLCLFVHMDRSPPSVQEDPSRSPNETYVQTEGR